MRAKREYRQYIILNSILVLIVNRQGQDLKFTPIWMHKYRRGLTRKNSFIELNTDWEQRNWVENYEHHSSNKSFRLQNWGITASHLKKDKSTASIDVVQITVAQAALGKISWTSVRRTARLKLRFKCWSHGFTEALSKEAKKHLRKLGYNESI